jgi:hypothetical protein
MSKDIVACSPDSMAKPGGHYSHAIVANAWL